MRNIPTMNNFLHTQTFTLKRMHTCELWFLTFSFCLSLIHAKTTDLILIYSRTRIEKITFALKSKTTLTASGEENCSFCLPIQ